jgi:hypothetical protein
MWSRRNARGVTGRFACVTAGALSGDEEWRPRRTQDSTHSSHTVRSIDAFQPLAWHGIVAGFVIFRRRWRDAQQASKRLKTGVTGEHVNLGTGQRWVSSKQNFTLEELRLKDCFMIDHDILSASLKILTMFKCQISVNLSIAAPNLVLLHCIWPITQPPSFKYMAWHWCYWVGREQGTRQLGWSATPLRAILLLGGRMHGVRRDALLTRIVFFYLLHYLHLQLVPWSLFISIAPGPHLVNLLICDVPPLSKDDQS